MKTITASELKNKLEHAEVSLIDVREPAEYRAEHISNAHLIPLADVTYAKLPSTDRPVVFHCGSGKRSEEACKKLLAENPNLEVYLLEGGIKAWKGTGFPVEGSGQKIIPLDRQAQIGAGSVVLLGVILGMLIHPMFYALSAFVGAGLIFAGLTGWCGMSQLLSKMPWNQ